MPEPQFSSEIQYILYFKNGSFTGFFGSDPASPGGQVQKKYETMACSHTNAKW
jgi:hypothetical protein